MVKPQMIVSEARAWIDTRFHHQGRIKGAGCDCVGLVIGVARNVGLDVIDRQDYPRRMAGRHLQREIMQQTDPVPRERVQPGDILVFEIDGMTHHVALVTEVQPMLRMIHAYIWARRVVEHHVDQWWEQRLIDVRRMRGVEQWAV